MSTICYNCFQDKPNEGPCPHCGYDGSEQAHKYPLALKKGAILNGRYIVGRVLGQGGFGITYLAQDYKTKERIAIKEYLPSGFVDRTQGTYAVQIYSGDRQENFEYGKTLFLNEAKTLAQVQGNRHIVRVYRYFEENNTAYFVMEYVDGASLAQYIKENGGRLSLEDACSLLLPVMEALDWVHKKGIVHRDIAPDNILISRDGCAKILDFGAARYSTGEKSKSLDVILKHGFAPKEQYQRHGRQGPFTDVYAMAATFYYTITGKTPPDAIDRMEDDALIPPSTLGVRISDKAEEVLYKALEVNASDRYQSMGQFSCALKAAVFSETCTASAEAPEVLPVSKPANDPAPEQVHSTVGGGGKKAPRNKKIIVSVLAAILLLAFLGGMAERFAQRRKESTVPAAQEAVESEVPSVQEPVESAVPSPQEPVQAEQDGDAATSDSTPSIKPEEHTALQSEEFRALQEANCKSLAFGYSIDETGCHLVGVKNDGTVVAVGSKKHGKLNVSDWTDIVSVSAGENFTAGLKSDGTVVAVGVILEKDDDGNDCYHEIQSYVADWTDIVAIVSNRFYITGLRADGTVVSTAPSVSKEIADWTDIVSITQGIDLFGLKSDGTVISTYPTSFIPSSGYAELLEWTDIVKIAASGQGQVIGLRTDGTVVMTEIRKDHESPDWINIIDVAAGNSRSYGLKADGTVACSGGIGLLSNALSNWTDIVAIFPSTEDPYNFVAGLKEDGTIVCYKDFDRYRLLDTTAFTDMRILTH